MTEILLQPEPLNAVSFKPYGEVIELSDRNEILSINDGRTQRHQALAHVDATEHGGEPIISLFKTELAQLPVRLSLMERHPLASQAFIPLQPASYLVVVAPAGEFEIDRLQAFIGNGSQGINYFRGVWHHPHLVLSGSGEFIVVDRLGPEENCDEVVFPDAVEVFVNA
ncbi:MAG: ureidoglycolate lyase [Pseudomonadota bacterium]